MQKNKYALLSQDEQESHLNNFIIPYFSHSSLSQYSRNPLEFQKRYIDLQRDDRKSDGMMIGSAYHKALDAYFSNRDYDWNEIALGEVCDEYIDALDETVFKFTKKWEGKEIEQLREHYKRYSKSCVSFFWENKKWFDENVQLVIGSEMRFFNFIRLDSLDYDIPLPLTAYIDLLFIDKDGFLAAMDHKTGSLNSPEETELMNMQQIALYNASINASMTNPEDLEMWESVAEKFPNINRGVKTFFIAQCKASKNRDGSPQMRIHPTDIKKKCNFFEAVIFSQMKAFFAAISNPDHTYTINMNDNFSDTVALIDYFIEKYQGSEAYACAANEQIQKNIIKMSKTFIEDLKNNSQFIKTLDMSTATPTQKINHKLSILGCPATVEEVIDSYSCVTFLLEPKATTSVKKVQRCVDDIAHVLGVSSVRIPAKLTELEKKSYISVEVNKKRTGKEEPLYLPDSPTSSLKIPLGQSIYDELITWDLENHTTPHVMIAGAAGSGKSVCIESIIHTIQKKGIPITVLDPKYEFTHLKNVDVLNEQKSIEEFMEYKVAEVDEIFKTKGARGNSKNRHVIIFDETADALLKQTTQRKLEVADASSRKAVQEDRKKLVIDRTFKTLEQNIVSIAQKARSAGIHLILAGQRFSVDVLKGAARANFTTRVCFTVAKKIDSMVMLDQEGAEELNGWGDALYLAPGIKEPIRMQGFLKK